MRTVLTVGIAIALLVAALSCWGEAARVVELRAGLASGELWAKLHGAGDSQVAGVIGRTGTEPIIAQLNPGTQYQAQLGGRQGQLGLGALSVDLTTTAVAQVVIPTACTNLGLPEPTPKDVMMPVACPDAHLVRLASLPQTQTAPHAAAQLAVWAITDNPRASGVRGYLREMAAAGTPDELAGTARQLLAACGLDPRGFRMFR